MTVCQNQLIIFMDDLFHAVHFSCYDMSCTCIQYNITCIQYKKVELNAEINEKNIFHQAFVPFL